MWAPPLVTSIGGNSCSPATGGVGDPHGPWKMAHASCRLDSEARATVRSTCEVGGTESAFATLMLPDAEPWLSVVRLKTADEPDTILKFPVHRAGPGEVVGRLLVAHDAAPANARPATLRVSDAIGF